MAILRKNEECVCVSHRIMMITHCNLECKNWSEPGNLGSGINNSFAIFWREFEAREFRVGISPVY